MPVQLKRSWIGGLLSRLLNLLKMNQTLVSIIIVNWNGRKFLEECLLSLSHQSFRHFEVILVDNGSEDDSLFFVQSRFPKVVLIPKKINSGFASGNNDGIKVARGKYIFTLNNDTKVKEDCLEHLFTVAEKSPGEVGMWAPKILSLQNPRVIDSVGGLLLYPDGIGKGRGRLEEDRGQYDDIRDILLPSACAALYRKEMLDEVRGFDEDFFAYCEDTDLGLRANIGGWNAWSVPQAVVYHYYSATGGKYSPEKAYLVERNRMWVTIKNYPPSLLAMVPFYSIRRYLYQVYGVMTGKGAGGRFVESSSSLELIKILVRAYYDGIKGIPRMYKKRKEILSIKRVSDGDMIRRIFMDSLSASKVVLQE